MIWFQNRLFEPGSWKNWQKPGFSAKFREVVSQTEVSEQPHFRTSFRGF
jgi:hypothetical protein